MLAAVKLDTSFEIGSKIEEVQHYIVRGSLAHTNLMFLMTNPSPFFVSAYFSARWNIWTDGVLCAIVGSRAEFLAKPLVGLAILCLNRLAH